VGEKLSATDTDGSVLEEEQWARPGSLTRGPRLSRRRCGTAHALRARNAHLVVRLATDARAEARTRRATAAAGRARGELGGGARPGVLGRGAGGPRCCRARGGKKLGWRGGGALDRRGGWGGPRRARARGGVLARGGKAGSWAAAVGRAGGGDGERGKGAAGPAELGQGGSLG
jgi:hypothetical protein